MIDGAELRKKLQIKAGARLLLVNVPNAFAAALVGKDDIRSAAPGEAFDCALAFCQTPTDVEAAIPSIMPRLPTDGLLWFAYRKGAAAKKSGLSRDVGWSPLAALGFETVRSIAFDEEWTGLRFRLNSAVKVRR